LLSLSLKVERRLLSLNETKEAHLASFDYSFLPAKDVELRSAVSELETHLRNTLTSLQDWKLRAATAEVRLSFLFLHFPPSRSLPFPLRLQSRLNDLKDDAGRSQSLEREVKEKNLLIGKLRHESEYRYRELSGGFERKS